LKTDPDWRALPDATPAEMRRLLRRSLERNPKNRLHDIADARIVLTEAMDGRLDPIASHGSVTGARTPGLWPALTALAITAAILTSVVAWRRGQTSPVEPPLVRFAVSSDPDLQIGTAETTPFAISADGRIIVFRAGLRGSADSLWARTLGDPMPRELVDTQDGGRPAISPDGAWVAFVVSNQIKKVRTAGGPVTHLATLNNTSGALSWVSNEEILYETIRPSLGIHSVSANGGVPKVLIPIDSSTGEVSQRRPLVIRDSRVVLYVSGARGRAELAAFSLEDGRRARIGVDGAQALGVVEDHLVWVRSDGTLMAAPFDARALKVTGPLIPLAERVGRSETGTKAALSQSGALLYLTPATPAAYLKVLDAMGGTRIETSEAKGFRWPRLSPDGRRIAVEIASGGLDPLTGEPVATDLWILDQKTLEPTRMTSTGRASRPEWTPDGRSLIYVARSSTNLREVWILPIDRSAEPRRLAEIEGSVQHAVMEPDGRSLIALTSGSAGGATEDMFRIPIDPPGAPSKILDMARLQGPRVSPDGRWLTYYERYAGDVHVRSLGDAGALQVTNGRGAMPAWAGDSRRLFYLTGAGLAVAELQTKPVLSVTRRKALSGFSSRIEEFDVSRDAQTFVVIVPVNPGEVQVAVNWGDELRRTLRARQAPSGPHP